MDPLAALGPEARAFLGDRHLATLSTIGPDGLIHVVTVGFTTHTDGLVRVITFDGSQKVRNVERDGRATVAQIGGSPAGRQEWISIAGRAEVLRDPADVRLAEDLYGARYRQPRINPQRVVIALRPQKILMSPGLRGEPPAHD